MATSFDISENEVELGLSSAPKALSYDEGCKNHSVYPEIFD